jgi:hypothetical protein
VSTTTTSPGLEELMPAARKLAARGAGDPVEARPEERALGRLPTGPPTIHAVLLAESAQQQAGARASGQGRDRMRNRPRASRPWPVSGRSWTRAPGRTSVQVPVAVAATDDTAPQVNVAAETGSTRRSPAAVSKRFSRWPLMLLALPAFVAIWSGWVDLGRLTGFGLVHPLPGIADRLLDQHRDHPAHRAWKPTPHTPSGCGCPGWSRTRARKFARWSAVLSLLLGFGGQAAYHLMVASGHGDRSMADHPRCFRRSRSGPRRRCGALAHGPQRLKENEMSVADKVAVIVPTILLAALALGALLHSATRPRRRR